MAQLTYNSINKFRYYGQELGSDDDEVNPEENLRDSLLKQIITSHLKKSININDCLINKNKFVASLKQEDISNLSKGLMTNEAYKKICEEADAKELLSSCGLENADINLLINTNYKRGKETNEAYLERLNNIQEKIKEKQTHIEDESSEQFSGVVKLNRHEFEEEKRKVVSSEAEKLTKCLVQLEPYSDPTVPYDHPINQLPNLAKKLFQETSKRKKECCREEVKKLKGPFPESYKYFSEKPDTLWDLKQKPIFHFASKEKHLGTELEKKSVKSNEEHKKPDYSKPFVWNLNPSQLVPVHSIISNRASVNELKMNPKFKSYDPGSPTSTLYIKNLPYKILPIFLASLFGHFQKENGHKNIEYRILRGKMKGQAFVHFSSSEVAGKALSLCNGFVIDSKPIVIEFGRKTINI